jgi:putative peptidoglycan lipid II flippase
MVPRILGFLYRETSSLNQAALLLGFFAFLSQVLAFLRDRLLAHIFGASLELDIYYAAFRIPDFLFVTVASVVSLSVLIPFIIDKEAHSREVLRAFIDNIFTFFLCLMGVSAVLAFWLMPEISAFLFRGLSAEALEEVISLSRFLLLSPIILGISNLYGSLTQAYNRFTTYALAPLLYNAGIIVGIMAWGESWGVKGVAYGVVIGAFLHALVQVPFLLKEKILPKPRAKLDFSTIKKVALISVPRTLTLSMSSIAMVALVALAARMVEGSISILSLSVNLQSVPLSLIGVSYSLAAFPTLTRQFRDKNLEGFLAQMVESARFILFWSLPLAALLIVLRAQVVRTLLGTGLFDWPATRLTAAALALFVLSSVFQSLMLLFMRGFYSAGFTKKPFFINLLATLVLIFSAYYLVDAFYQHETFRYFVTTLMKVENVPGSAVLMLPLGFSIGTALNCLILWWAFERAFPGFTRGTAKTFFESLGAACLMGAASYIGLNFLDTVFNLETLSGIFFQGLLAGLFGIAVGIAVLSALKSRELSQVWKAFHTRFWRARAIATDPEIV